MDEDRKHTPENKPQRSVSKAPRPGLEVHGALPWRLPDPGPDERPVKIPDCTPFVSPELSAKTAVTVAEAAQKFTVRAQMLELCKYVIAELTPHFSDAVTGGTVRPHSALAQMRDLLHELLKWNSDNKHRWMLGASAATAEYPLEQTIRRSDEWLTFAKAISDASDKMVSAVQKHDTGQRTRKVRSSEAERRRGIVAGNLARGPKSLCVLFDQQGVPLPNSWTGDVRNWQQAEKSVMYRQKVRQIISKDKRALKESTVKP